MTTLTVGSFDGLALHAVASGKAAGPVVVLSHSIGCDLAMWDPVAAALEPDFRVLRFDRRAETSASSAEANKPLSRIRPRMTAASCIW